MVSFKVGSQSAYDAISVPDPDALYFIEDTQRIYKGQILLGTASNPEPIKFETGSIETKMLYQKGFENYTMKGSYQLIGDYCIMSVTALTKGGWGICYYPLPVSATCTSQIIAYADSTLEIKTNGQQNQSVISIEDINFNGSDPKLPEGSVSFTMCYRWK